jgi:hypothetical protein
VPAQENIAGFHGARIGCESGGDNRTRHSEEPAS